MAVSEMDESCRIYLVIPPGPDEDLERWLVPVLEQDHVACVLLQTDCDGQVDRDLAQRLIGVAHEQDVPLLIENSIEAAAELRADGVEIEADETTYEAARQRLREEAMVGARCGASKHAAMVMAERGADYVAFGAGQEELIGWWGDLFEVPCVASGIEAAAQALTLAERGADFVAIGDGFWNTAEAPADAIATLHLALSRPKSAA
ncbi:MAG: thiamine phosphate synthase [Methyloligellaceae bacterium]